MLYFYFKVGHKSYLKVLRENLQSVDFMRKENSGLKMEIASFSKKIATFTEKEMKMSHELELHKSQVALANKIIASKDSIIAELKESAIQQNEELVKLTDLFSGLQRKIQEQDAVIQNLMLRLKEVEEKLKMEIDLANNPTRPATPTNGSFFVPFPQHNLSASSTSSFETAEKEKQNGNG